MQSPDISILAYEFLAEVQGMVKKNLATEAESYQAGRLNEPKVTFWSR